MGKIKHFLESEKGKDIIIIVIVILVGLVSFELGRLSSQSAKSGLKIEYGAQEANISSSIKSNTSNISQNTDNLTNITGNYFASKNGKKYYGITCSAGKTIKQENRIYFSSSVEASNAGYELSSSCR